MAHFQNGGQNYWMNSPIRLKDHTKQHPSALPKRGDKLMGVLDLGLF